LRDKTEATFASEELRALLLDPASLRERRMIEVGSTGKKISIHLRVRDGSLASAAELAGNYSEEFALIRDEVLRRATVDPELSPEVESVADLPESTLDGKHPGGWFPEQRITVAEAIEAHTLGAYGAWIEIAA
jgi:hypothetical protein